jgi:uncharacterized protein YceK
MMKHISKQIGFCAVGLSGLIALGGCSTLDRLGKNDQGVYAGTRASTSDPNGNPIDTAFSAIGDTILLPYTGIRYLFGYRYEEPRAGVSMQNPPSNSPGATAR